MLLRVAISVFALLLGVSPARANSAAIGLTGLGEMRTPESLKKGRSEVYLHGRFASIDEGVGARLSPGLGVNYGILDKLEAGLQIPFRSVDGQSGLGNVPLLGKYRFFESDLLNFAGTLMIGIPAASKDSEMGSGAPGFAGEVDGSLTFGGLDLLGSLAYGKNDYCARCEYPGVQRRPEVINVPVLNLAGGLAYGDADYTAFAELHFNNVANGRPAGTVAGDADLYLLLGGRYNLTSEFGLTGYAGAGPMEGANSTVVANAVVSYAFGAPAAGEPEEEEEAAPAEKPAPKPAAKPELKPVPKPAPPPPLFVDVVDACQAPEFTNKFVSNLKAKKINAKLAGAAKKMDQSAIYFTDAGVNLGSEVARFMTGKQKMYKQASIPGGAAARVFIGCDMAAPPPPPEAAKPLPPKKPKESINVAVVNGCGKPGLAEDAAKTLLLNAYNVTKIYDEPKPTTPGLTEIRFREEYKDEAADIAAKLPGQQRLFVDRALAEDEDLKVQVGCKQ